MSRPGQGRQGRVVGKARQGKARQVVEVELAIRPTMVPTNATSTSTSTAAAAAAADDDDDGLSSRYSGGGGGCYFHGSFFTQTLVRVKPAHRAR
ncbi:hypothetical protein BDBG_06944 [Blastomyces gilchristii SLH14081]|uniref:Uncharacterized protein n=1 Tax=Blastomyces gilchristii (strain SLH14081) TaxID=559298 RepID=A0A179UUF3_BLAGS|nr:uncharacterized protein BDBG_06944 [Blastomyces gilchristii SLH14081]OAT11460.1 hypothetical protein BDBG_06944 [Blastomyces gilchristii SLH14081]